jgi:hypothetical protein
MRGEGDARCGTYGGKDLDEVGVDSLVLGLEHHTPLAAERERESERASERERERERERHQWQVFKTTRLSRCAYGNTSHISTPHIPTPHKYHGISDTYKQVPHGCDR